MKTMSGTYPVQASALKKGGYVILQGQPCILNRMTISKTGKHGHAKAHLFGTNVFTNKKVEDNQASTHNMEVPNIKRNEYLLQYVDDEGFLSLMDDNGTMKEDVRLPENELGQEILAALNKETDKEILVCILSAMDEEAAISFKVTQITF